ncbi:hypothetical protein [Ilumatobacter sp.]|uniref:hypothetical protein n=1 Tax=Ilumatobacter sp. TaxID=1967498 RepID=UPI0037528FD6
MERDLIGSWRIVEMDVWDLDAIELVGPALMQVHSDGHGEFGFIAVQGQLDWKQDPGSTSERIAFTWEGDDEGDRVSGRGWASVNDADHLIGHIYFHLGDDSGFRAVREPKAWGPRSTTTTRFRPRSRPVAPRVRLSLIPIGNGESTDTTARSYF